MSRKKLAIFVPLLFAVIGLLWFITSRRASQTHELLAAATVDSFSRVTLSRDGTEGDLVLMAKDQGDLEEMVQALHTLQPLHVTMRTLEVVSRTRMVLEREGDELVVDILRTNQRGDNGVVSVAVRDSLGGEKPAGTFSSRELLAWAEAMAQRPSFKDVKR